VIRLRVMADFTKLVAAIKRWGWGRASFVLALALLIKQFVTFDQALILILLAVVLEEVVRRESRPSGDRTPGLSLTRKNGRRR